MLNLFPRLVYTSRYLFSEGVPYLLPSMSPTMAEGTIVSWAVKEGDVVEAGDVLLELETDKASLDVEADDDCLIVKILHDNASGVLPVGTMIAVTAEADADINDVTIPEAPAVTGADSQAAPAAQSPAPSQSDSPAAPSAPAQVQAAPMQQSQSPSGRSFASPIARHAAATNGININIIPGSGKGGRVTLSDVANAPAATQTPIPQAQLQSPHLGATFTEIPHNNIRRVTARRLVESKTSAPHYYLTRELNVSTLLKLRQKLNSSADIDENGKPAYKLSVNDFILKASALALKDVPQVNAQWGADSIIQYDDVNISVAVQAPSGLTTPTIRNVDLLGLADISSDVKTQAGKARNNKLAPEDFEGGTFTVSNLGMYGIDSFTSIINPPQSAILAVGKTSKKVVEIDSSEEGTPQFQSQDVMNVTLSCDHRVVDGVLGATWLDSLATYMENPDKMLL